ncbi:class I SAM-dependent methyltransferase [soil metagenome]
MGTGGGEVLLDLAETLPDDTVATEGWQPNVPIATTALAPHGIEVVFYDAETDPAMPFEENRFDLVLNRHEAYAPDEVRRILQPKGHFFTQQVDGRSFKESRQLFGGRSNYEHVTLDNFRLQLEEAGFAIKRAREWAGTFAFASVAAMVRYFAIVPWDVPDDFSVDRYADILLDLHRTAADLVFTQRRFLIMAQR